MFFVFFFLKNLYILYGKVLLSVDLVFFARYTGKLNPDELYESRWQFCSALTTQHSLSIVALTNTLMSMSQISFLPGTKGSRADKTTKGSDVEAMPPDDASMAIASMIRANIKAGWSRLATLYCCLLPDKLDMAHYRPPLLHVLARRWQDRCLEVLLTHRFSALRCWDRMREILA